MSCRKSRGEATVLERYDEIARTRKDLELDQAI